MVSEINNNELRAVRDSISVNGQGVRAWQIKEELAKIKIDLDESTIRGRFIEMGEPLSGITVGSIKTEGVQRVQKTANLALHLDANPTPPQPPKPVSKKIDIAKKVFQVAKEILPYVPNANDFIGYIGRPIDARLALHLDSSRPGHWKYPIAQGKQGTGKTFSYMFYAYQNNLPFFLFSCYEDFKLSKLFGDKTIIGGNVEFKEGLLTKAIQGPSMILFDEVNYVSNENSVDFHAFLQNRELFVKDADNGNGKIYRLHDDCKVGFAQNPKSAKYIGGNIKPSSFLGRCTFITYPEFEKKDIKKAITTRFPNLVTDDVNKFTDFYFACCDTIEQAQIPVDVSIRQLNNVIDLYNHGMPLKEAIEDGLTSIMEAASQPKNKEAFYRLAQGVWKEMMDKSIGENVGTFSNFLRRWM